MSRLPLLAHETPEAVDLDLGPRTWGSVMKHRVVRYTWPAFSVLLFLRSFGLEKM